MRGNIRTYLFSIARNLAFKRYRDDPRTHGWTRIGLYRCRISGRIRKLDANGNTRDIRVTRPLGLGLDEKAIEAVSKWRFRPAMKNGRPVAVQAQVEVNFRLL